MALTIRFATPDDARIVVRLIRGLAEYERDLDAVKVTADDLRVQMASDDPPFECLLAEYEAAPAGFALFFRNYSTWSGRPGLYLEDLFVRDEYRGRGVGGALTRRLAAIVAERGWARMDWAVLDWNTPALRFYAALGAEPMSEWTVQRVSGPKLALLAR
ncbi:MAG: GNAT family N-acetyltransferase [Candidatus Binataceae bacterium]